MFILENLLQPIIFLTQQVNYWHGITHIRHHQIYNSIHQIHLYELLQILMQKRTIGKVLTAVQIWRSHSFPKVVGTSHLPLQNAIKCLTLKDKIKVLDFFKLENKLEGKGMTQMEVLSHFRGKFPSLLQPTISWWRKQEDSEELWNRAKDLNQLSYKNKRQVAFPQVKDALSAYMTFRLSQHLPRS